MNLQHRCADLLIKNGMTQATLADNADIDRADMSRLLNSDTPRFTVRTILKLAKAFSMTPMEFLSSVDEIPERLNDEIRWWIEQFAAGEAAIRQRDDLQRALDLTAQQAAEMFTALEQRHAAELLRLRTTVEAETAARQGAEDVARKAEDAAADSVRVAENETQGLRVEVARLRIQIADGARREQALFGELAKAKDALVTTQKALTTAQKSQVATGVLSALFGAGAGALLAASQTDGSED